MPKDEVKVKDVYHRIDKLITEVQKHADMPDVPAVIARLKRAKELGTDRAELLARTAQQRLELVNLVKRGQAKRDRSLHAKR